MQARFDQQLPPSALTPDLLSSSIYVIEYSSFSFYFCLNYKKRILIDLLTILLFRMTQYAHTYECIGTIENGLLDFYRCLWQL